MAELLARWHRAMEESRSRNRQALTAPPALPFYYSWRWLQGP